MNKRLLVVGCMTVMSAVYGQTTGQQRQSLNPTSASASAQRALLDQYCVSCHSEKAKAAGMESAVKLTLDNLDLAHVGDHAETWEKVVRKLRAGMMPPANMKRPDPGAYNGLIVWLE